MLTEHVSSIHLQFPLIRPNSVSLQIRVHQYIHLTLVMQAMKEGKYTTASDVWSYGIVMYEIWNIGLPPYSDISGNHVSGHGRAKIKNL